MGPSPSQGLKFFTDSSRMSPFHVVQSFRKRLLQRGSPCRNTSPGRKSAPVWAPVSKRPQVLPGACSNAGLPWGQSPLWVSTCSIMGSSSAPPRTSTACRGTASSPWSSSQASGESQLWCLMHLFPLLFYQRWCLQGYFSHIFSLLSFGYFLCSRFFFSPFLNK